MTEIPEQPTDLELCRVAVRLPPFWPDRPAIWFAQAESQFELAAITRQRTKFNYVVSQLNQQQAAEVEDIITAPPEHEPYDRLKTELIRRLSTSSEQRVRQLLSHEEMGDRKPSQFLRHLKSLAPDVADDFLRTVWFSRLPPHVQAILPGQCTNQCGCDGRNNSTTTITVTLYLLYSIYLLITSHCVVHLKSFKATTLQRAVSISQSNKQTI